MNNKHAIHKQLTTHYSLLTNFAFTLAETLIVMGIIGVVAALTLPNLNSSTGDKEKVVKVKKVYQNLNDAMGRAVAVYGPVEDWFVNDANATAQITRVGERLTEFMKLSKNCKMTKGCYTSGSGTSSYDYEFILADGTSVQIYGNKTNISFTIDIDGITKGKNILGYDRFYFHSSENNRYDLLPGDSTPMTDGASTVLACCSVNIGMGLCSKWVIDYDNMDYLKLDSSGKCPNGTALNVIANPPVVSCK
ncbi:prepilin-type N-terminal cleavage/methylation domain-containing protein [bacterium]|nr:prepilin-type N-terminal cleavage/methylation domain-containing protein [bacterium]